MANNITLQIETAQTAFLKWRGSSFAERAGLMRDVALILRQDVEKYAAIISNEMGKPFLEAKSEIEKSAWACEYYADNAESFLKDENIKTENTKSYVSYQPLGVVLAVMPWNFPFWQVFRFAAPAIMAGNAIVLKHASGVKGCAAAIEKIFKQAGFAEGIFINLDIDKKQVEEVIADKNIKAVTFTGSVAAGKKIAEIASQYAKKVVLELGGSDAYIVLPDANIEQAAQYCVMSRMINGGQSCVAAKRFIAHDSIHDIFVEKVISNMKSYVMGYPMQEGVTLGPMASIKQRDELHEQVKTSVKKGAKIVLGGQISDMEGAFYPPTVLIDVKKGTPAYDDELFGPVAAIIRANDEADAINIANDSCFGLGAAVFTSDIEKGEDIARNKIESGMCFVNSIVKSDPRLPFGGVKESGYGRELSHFGILEFVNVKTVVVSG